jgi:hypothetical protein
MKVSHSSVDEIARELQCMSEIYDDSDAQFFQKATRRLRILGARRVTWSKLHAEDQQTFGVTVQN